VRLSEVEIKTAPVIGMWSMSILLVASFLQLLLNVESILLDLFQSLGLPFHSTKHLPNIPHSLLINRPDFIDFQIDFTCSNTWSVNINIRI